MSRSGRPAQQHPGLRRTGAVGLRRQPELTDNGIIHYSIGGNNRRLRILFNIVVFT